VARSEGLWPIAISTPRIGRIRWYGAAGLFCKSIDSADISKWYAQPQGVLFWLGLFKSHSWSASRPRSLNCVFVHVSS
jgi:hypothetical protein